MNDLFIIITNIKSVFLLYVELYNNFNTHGILIYFH